MFNNRRATAEILPRLLRGTGGSLRYELYYITTRYERLRSQPSLVQDFTDAHARLVGDKRALKVRRPEILPPGRSGTLLC